MIFVLFCFPFQMFGQALLFTHLKQTTSCIDVSKGEINQNQRKHQTESKVKLRNN